MLNKILNENFYYEKNIRELSLELLLKYKKGETLFVFFQTSI